MQSMVYIVVFLVVIVCVSEALSLQRASLSMIGSSKKVSNLHAARSKIVYPCQYFRDKHV
jgi:hypothetical protein